jgi:SAM-dependent methyltransferase
VPGLPDYNTQLAAFHRAFEPELTAIIASLPLAPGMQVLDLACGDGFYTRRLAERLGPGRVVGADVDPAYLAAAQAATASYAGPATIELVRASYDELPFADGTFDLVWCAQSLYSLPDPVAVLRHLCRVVRPGGVVGVLENDTLHQVFLPWPASLELALRSAELTALATEEGNASRFYVGRRLPAVFAAAGLTPTALTTFAIDRRAPFTDIERTLLQSYLDGVVDRVTPYLGPAVLANVVALTAPGAPENLVDQPYATLTWLNVLALGAR